MLRLKNEEFCSLFMLIEFDELNKIKKTFENKFTTTESKKLKIQRLNCSLARIQAKPSIVTIKLTIECLFYILDCSRRRIY